VEQRYSGVAGSLTIISLQIYSHICFKRISQNDEQLAKLWIKEVDCLSCPVHRGTVMLKD